MSNGNLAARAHKALDRGDFRKDGNAGKRTEKAV